MPEKSIKHFRETLQSSVSLDEALQVRKLVKQVALNEKSRSSITTTADRIVQAVRMSPNASKLEQFLAEYGLSSQEGVALMCLAEAMLRVPDNYTVDALIRDKIVPHDWSSHIGGSGSLLVNLSTWA